MTNADKTAVQQILQDHPLKFHFDSGETYFPIDERKNNLEFLFRKYNHLHSLKSEKHTNADQQFLEMMREFHNKFDQIITTTSTPPGFIGLGFEPDLDQMNLFVHDYSLRNVIMHGELSENERETLSEIIGKEKFSYFLNKSSELPILTPEDIKKMHLSGLKLAIQEKKLFHRKSDILTPHNVMTCEALTDKIAKGVDQNLGVAFNKSPDINAPLYYNLQKSADGKKFVMQFGLNYAVNEGMTFPLWVKPLVRLFVKFTEKFVPKLYNKIKGTSNGKIGFHLGDREIGHYEGIIENGTYKVTKVALTGHGPKALEVRNIKDISDVNVYVGVGGHPNYFTKTQKINKALEEIPILGAASLASRMLLKHGDHADGKGKTLIFNGTNNNIRDWQTDSVFESQTGRGAPSTLVSQRLFFHSFEDFQQKVKVSAGKVKVTLQCYETEFSRWHKKQSDIPKTYKEEKIIRLESINIPKTRLQEHKSTSPTQLIIPGKCILKTKKSGIPTNKKNTGFVRSITNARSLPRAEQPKTL